jgi:PAS domain S-box-containing protein
VKSDTKKSNSSNTILVVEDSPTQAEQLKYSLEQHSYQTIIAGNGKEAISYLSKHKPLMVITDILMPEIDGYELCKRIESDEKLKHIPVILLTSLSEAKDIIKGLQCCADSFIKKPYDEKYLLSRINYLLTNIELRKSEKVQFGVEVILSGERHFITSERQQILDLLISTYEQAVRINEELEHSYKTLDGLYNVAKQLNKCTRQKDVVEKVLEEVIKLPGIKAVWILLKESGTKLKLAGVRGLPAELDTPEFFEGECLCIRKLLSGELNSVTNILECERLQKANVSKSEIRFHASIPLLSTDQTIGVMNLAGSEKDLFSDAELETFYAIGNQIGSAIERARLIENLEQLVDERTSKLLETEIWFRTVFNSQQDSVLVIAPDRKIVNMNIAAEKLFGYTIDEVKGKSTEIFHVDRDHYETFGKRIFESFERGEHARFEFQLKKKNGKIFPSEHTVSFIQDESGNITGIVSVVRNITERKRAEKALQESELRFRSVWEKSIDGMRITNEEGTVVLANDAYCKMMEKPREEIEGKPISVIYEVVKQMEVLRKHQERFLPETSPLI